MARLPRQNHPGAWHHVFHRGARYGDVFVDDLKNGKSIFARAVTGSTKTQLVGRRVLGVVPASWVAPAHRSIDRGDRLELVVGASEAPTVVLCGRVMTL